MEPDIRYARSSGVSIAYQVVGEGDTDLVFVPDFCSNLVYAYEEFGHTYMGCMQKIYEVEIDLDLLSEAERRRRDGFGAVRATRTCARCWTRWDRSARPS